MSILETFYFLFEADASKLDRGLDEANRKTDRLEANLKDTDAAGGKLGDTLLQIAGSVGAAIGGFMALSNIKAMVLDTASAMDDLGDAAAALDIPVEELSAWSMAATMVDGTQQEFISSLQNINTGIVALATTGKGRLLPFLKEMGLSMSDVETASKDPLFALQKMSDKFQALSRAEAAGLGAKLGLDQGTINLLSQGRQGLDELIKKQKELGVQTKEQTEQAAKFEETVKEWNHTFGAVKREIVTTLLPPIIEFVKILGTVVRWMAENKGFVLGFFSIVAAVLIGVYAPAALTAARATWALIAPWALVVAGILLASAAIALIAEDLYQFGQGNDSITGRLAEKWPFLGEAIKGIGKVLAWLISAVQIFAALFVDAFLGGPEYAVNKFYESVSSLVDDISSMFPLVGVAFDVMTGMMEAGIKAVISLWEWLTSKIESGGRLFSKAIDAVKGFFSGSGMTSPDINQSVNVNRQNIARGGELIRSTNTPLASMTSNSISNRADTRSKTTNNTVNTGPITVQTQATDGDKVAAELGRSLSSQMRSAIDENDDGVVA